MSYVTGPRLRRWLILGAVLLAGGVLAACDVPACWVPVEVGEGGLVCGSPDPTVIEDNGDGTATVFTCVSCQEFIESVGGPSELCEEVEVEECEGQTAYFCGVLLYEVFQCEEPSSDPIAPSVWLAGVCEPDDGFSADGWLTMGGDPGNFSTDRTLYVAGSPEGPWVAVQVNGPPWVFDRPTLDALAADRGVAGYGDLWFKLGEPGNPARLGSMIVDREAHMDEYCGASTAP